MDEAANRAHHRVVHLFTCDQLHQAAPLCRSIIHMERLRAYFADQGLQAQDVPKAVIIHEVIGAAFAIGFWSACYTVQPSKTFMRPVASAMAKNKTLERMYAASFVRAQRTVQSASWLRKAPGIGR